MKRYQHADSRHELTVTMILIVLWLLAAIAWRAGL